MRDLTADDLKVFLSKLEAVQEIDEFHINDFLIRASERDARAVVDVLLRRIRRDRGSLFCADLRMANLD